MTSSVEAIQDLDPADGELADRLRAERAAPAAAFRGALGRQLGALDPGHGPRPPNLRRVVAGLVGGGSLLILIGALTSGIAL